MSMLQSIQYRHPDNSIGSMLTSQLPRVVTSQNSLPLTHTWAFSYLQHRVREGGVRGQVSAERERLLRFLQGQLLRRERDRGPRESRWVRFSMISRRDELLIFRLLDFEGRSHIQERKVTY